MTRKRAGRPFGRGTGDHADHWADIHIGYVRVGLIWLQITKTSRRAYRPSHIYAMSRQSVMSAHA